MCHRTFYQNVLNIQTGCFSKLHTNFDLYVCVQVRRIFTFVKIIKDNETKHYLYIQVYHILIQHYQRNKTYNEIYIVLNEMKFFVVDPHNKHSV